MITHLPSQEELEEWKSAWTRCRDRLRPGRKSGPELVEYLRARYPMTELADPQALDAVAQNVTMNAHWAEKLPDGAAPEPRAFYLENAGAGKKFYRPENRDSAGLWGGSVERIFVGIDLASGFYMVEGSTLLWDELCAFQGVDETDLRNYVCVAQYLGALRRMGKEDGLFRP